MNKENYFDMIIVGAGISGIGVARHLQDKCPSKTFAIIETKPSFGGTWHTHKYPGVRSDSDMYTFGYKFKPWISNPIGTGAEILNYLGEALEEGNLGDHIHYQRRIISASWSTEQQLWLLKVCDTQTGTVSDYSCNFLWMAAGYYSHDKGYTPDFPNIDDFKGTIVHPQTWPEDLDYKGKKVIVIGSGATAATLNPAMADDCHQLIMLQRSPTYFVVDENRNELADTLRALNIDEEWIHEIVRKSLLKHWREIFDAAAAHPEETTKQLLEVIRGYVGEDFDLEKHFLPRYEPGQQRIALIPGGNLFKKVAEGKIKMVTDHIDRFTETGILTQSGEHLDADIIVTATGFNIKFAGDIAFDINGKSINFGERYCYHGFMVSGVPNMISIFGYLRTSWTMRVDLLSETGCRLINHMSDKGYSSCTAELEKGEEDMERASFFPDGNFNAGYIKRGINTFPKQGDREPWTNKSDYYVEREIFPKIDFEKDVLVFAKSLETKGV